MLKKKINYRRVLTLTVMFYMVSALAWWTVLLFRQNNELLELKRMIQVDQGSFENMDEWIKIKEDHQRSQAMVIGEGLVFIGMLGVGLYLINRAYFQEISISNQKQNFLLSITHELKSPIAGMRLVYETLLTRNLPRAQQKSLIEGALKENKRLEGLVNNLLLTTKIESGFVAEKEEFNLHHYLEQIIYSYRQIHPQIQFNLNYSGNENIFSDRGILRLILTNLIENAIKYTPEKGNIMINSAGNPQDYLLVVADEGPGIPDDEKKKIFDKFYRIGNEQVRKTHGTGLGLYIVNKLVKTLHGFIEVKNNQPRGTIFEIKIPVSE